jgi:Sap, sulfolipid-1-addressing protein
VGAAIAQMIPFALGKMIAVNPTIAVILLLVSAHGHGKAIAYLTGAFVGPLIAGLFLIPLVGTVVPSADDGDPTPLSSAVHLVIGLLFLFLAYRGWHRRSAKKSADGKLPGWMRVLDGIGTGGAFGLGAAMTVFGVKNLLMLTGLVAVISEFTLSPVQQISVLIGFVLISTLPVATPLIAATYLGPRADAVLGAWKEWLVQNSDLILVGFSLILGVLFTLQGAIGLVKLVA